MVMCGFVYWPWSKSPTKILFRFLVLKTLVLLVVSRTLKFASESRVIVLVLVF